MTTRSQKRKAAVECVPTSLETLLAESSHVDDLVHGPSKNPRTHFENRDDIKSSLRKEIMSDLTKILAENQKEMLKLIAATIKNPIAPKTWKIPTQSRTIFSQLIHHLQSDQKRLSKKQHQ